MTGWRIRIRRQPRTDKIKDNKLIVATELMILSRGFLKRWICHTRSLNHLHLMLLVPQEQIVFLNCPGHLGSDGVKNLVEFVEQDLFTTTGLEACSTGILGTLRYNEGHR